jgi:hypothetical protein
MCLICRHATTISSLCTGQKDDCYPCMMCFMCEIQLVAVSHFVRCTLTGQEVVMYLEHWVTGLQAQLGCRLVGSVTKRMIICLLQAY